MIGSCCVGRQFGNQVFDGFSVWVSCLNVQLLFKFCVDIEIVKWWENWSLIVVGKINDFYFVDFGFVLNIDEFKVNCFIL